MLKFKSALFLLLAAAGCVFSVSAAAAQSLLETDQFGNRHSMSFSRQVETGLVVVKNQIELSGRNGMSLILTASLTQACELKSFVVTLVAPPGTQLAGEMEWLVPKGRSLYFLGKIRTAPKPEGRIETAATFLADLGQLAALCGQKGAREGVVLRLFGTKGTLVEIPIPVTFLRLLGDPSGYAKVIQGGS
jgi:hypothetical protein